MAALSASLLLASSFWIERQARQELEGELTLRLQAVGTAASSLIGPALVPGLLSLSPTQERFPFYRDRKAVLTQLRDRTGVRRVFLADTSGRSFVDTDTRVSIGAPMTQLRSDRVEIREVLRGHPAAAALFIDEEGHYRKTGYVPVLYDDRVIGLIGVEADASFLQAIRTLRTRILGIGAAGIVASFVLAAVAARGLTRPLQRLVGWARELGGGDLSRPAPASGRDEIAFLGRTLEQMRERLEARDREQRAMVAGVAHEIRNPLGGIRLYAELLAGDAALDDVSRERLRKILKELDQLGFIVDEFLLFARPAVPTPQEVQLKEVVPELADWLRPQAEKRLVALEVEEPGGGRPWPVVQADPTHLRQILQNLVLNAIDASPAQGTVSIRTTGEAGEVAIEVSDQGPGIDPAARERVFEPFFTTKPAGAGLGLAIVRRLALLNGMRIEVVPGRDRGACFRLTCAGAPA